MILYQTTHTLIEVLDKTIICTAKNIIPFEDWKKSFSVGLSFLKENWNGEFTWINDLTNLKAIGPEHLVFLQECVNNEAFQFYPPVQVVFVEPKSFTGKACMYGYIFTTNIRLDKNINIEVVKTMNEALDYVKNKQKNKNNFENRIQEQINEIHETFNYEFELAH